MPGDSKLWIYQAHRKMTIKEIVKIKAQLCDFCSNWESHGKRVQSSFQLYDWFLFLLVDESDFITSGCSIDSSVKLIKKIASSYDINFFNRTNIAYIQDDHIKVSPLQDFKKIMTNTTIIYDNSITRKKQLNDAWRVRVGDTWLSKFLK
tara:strand:- start:31 stop:477 length:447 start_codon:yes stop_codon:yes gene_type:complete